MTSSSNCTATAVESTNNIVAFRPRASSLAVQAIAAAGVNEADEALGRVLADHARFATEADARKWKVAPGEIFMMTGGTCGGRKPATVESIAAKMGLAVQTVHNRRSRLKRVGVIEVRRCSRTRCSIIFRIPGTLPPASWRPVVKTGSKTDGKTDQEPRTEPKKEPRVTRRCSERRTPDAPSKGQARFMAELLCERNGLKPGDADQFIEAALKKTRYQISAQIGELIRMDRGATMARWRPPAEKLKRIETLRARIAREGDDDGVITRSMADHYRKELEKLEVWLSNRSR